MSLKKLIVLFLTLSIVTFFSGCYNETVTYKNVSENSRITDLHEIRERRFFDILPDDLETKDVSDYYFNWELGFIGSASVEYHYSIKYEPEKYEDEIQRISGYRSDYDKALQYDDKTFILPAYVAVLGYDDTNAYILTDKENNIIHYVYLSLLQKNKINLDEMYLPEGYTDNGDNENASYSIFWDD